MQILYSPFNVRLQTQIFDIFSKRIQANKIHIYIYGIRYTYTYVYIYISIEVHIYIYEILEKITSKSNTILRVYIYRSQIYLNNVAIYIQYMRRMSATLLTVKARNLYIDIN